MLKLNDLLLEQRLVSVPLRTTVWLGLQIVEQQNTLIQQRRAERQSAGRSEECLSIDCRWRSTNGSDRQWWQLTIHLKHRQTDSKHKWHRSPRVNLPPARLLPERRGDRHLNSMLILPLSLSPLKRRKTEATGARINSIRFASSRKQQQCDLTCLSERQHRRQFAAICCYCCCWCSPWLSLSVWALGCGVCGRVRVRRWSWRKVPHRHTQTDITGCFPLIVPVIVLIVAIAWLFVCCDLGNGNYIDLTTAKGYIWASEWEGERHSATGARPLLVGKLITSSKSKKHKAVGKEIQCTFTN